MKTTSITITIAAAVMLATSVGRTDEVGRLVRIYRLGEASAKEGDTINFYGFFPGMSRHDAQFLAERYDLEGNECYIHADGENSVYSITLNIKAISRMLKTLKIDGQTYEEIAQAVANAVGDLQNKGVRNLTGNIWGGRTYVDEHVSQWYERQLVNGTYLKLNRYGMKITGNEGIRSKMPIETAEAREQRIKAEKTVIPDLLSCMVDIPVKSNSMMPFKIGKYEVTQLQWVHVMGKCPSRRMSTQIGSSNSGDCPVDNVSWNDCQEFFKEFNALPEVKETGLVFRLPTAEEWEYACRAGATEGISKLSDGTEVTKRKISDVAWIDADKTKPVGLKTPNAFGLFDMIGNVSEWTYSLDGTRDDDAYIYMGGCYESKWNDESSRNLWRESSNYVSYTRGFRLCASKFKIQPARKASKPTTDIPPSRKETASSRRTRGSTKRAIAKEAISKAEDAQAAADTEPEITVVSTESVSIPEKDKKFKKQVVELCRLPPNFDSAGKWFLLAKEIESEGLRQLVLKASGAALLYVQKQKVYNLKVKPMLKDASLFEQSFYVTCSGCAGKKNVEKKCTACAGSGVCKYSNCRNGQHLVHDFGGNHYEECRDCKGSGECQKCGASGVSKSKCLRCNGKGVAYSRDAVAEAYQNYVTAISQSFQ